MVDGSRAFSTRSTPHCCHHSNNHKLVYQLYCRSGISVHPGELACIHLYVVVWMEPLSNIDDHYQLTEKPGTVWNRSLYLYVCGSMALPVLLSP